MRAIIPCAGFGTRMGMLPHEAKELLLDDSGLPMINWTLSLCSTYELDPLLLVRKEKQSLIDYCEELNIKTVVVKPEGEWPNTIAQSYPYWDKNNFLLLPDTRFQMLDAILTIKKHLALGCSMVIGTHTVSDPEKWGVIDDYMILEKSDQTKSTTAWGVIAFKRCVDSLNFFADMETHKSGELHDASFVNLGSFRDITRK